MHAEKALKLLLLAGAIYFFTVALVHFSGIKVPMLFVYYDVESTVYQDRIISVLSFLFSVFLYAGYQLASTEIVKYILFGGIVAIIGLVANNFFTRITFRNNPIYWIEIGLLGLYVTGLAIFYKKVEHK